jgi:o-succinylbenzoate synthase
LKIARLRWTTYRVPFRTPYSTSQGVQAERQGLLLELTSDSRLVGLGEAAPTPESGLEAEVLSQTFAAVASALVGLDIDALPTPNRQPPTPDPTHAALACALDTAVCDLLAQEGNFSLARYLRTEAAASVEVNALVTAPDLIEAVKAARAARDAGYRTVKLKVGMADEATLECARIVAVRKTLGPEVKLRLDPNGAWDIATAMTVLRAVEPLDIEYVEQPLAAGNLDAMAYLQSRLKIPIAADEDVTDIAAAQRVINAGAARVLILKPQRLGGVRPSLQLIEAAGRAEVACVVTTSIETGVGTAACLHLAAALPPGSPASGLATAALLESDLTLAPIVASEGSMRLPDGAGLGVQLDPEALVRYTDGWREA